MFKSPYETTACRNHKIGDIVDTLVQLQRLGELYPGAGRIRLVTEQLTQVKAFAHPIVHSFNGDAAIYIDVRGVTRFDRSNGELIGSSDYAYLLSRARLMDVAWVDDNPLDLLNLSDLPMKVFSRLLSENLGRRMNLDASVQVWVQIAAAYFYLCQFYNLVGVEQDDLIKHAKRVSRATGVVLTMVMDVITAVGPMMTIQAFADAVKTHSGSIRLESLSPAIIYTMLGGIWYGPNNVENVAVALEHPPTFTAMLYAACNDRSYRKSILAQIVQRVDRRGDLSKVFVQNVMRLLKVD